MNWWANTVFQFTVGFVYNGGKIGADTGNKLLKMLYILGTLPNTQRPAGDALTFLKTRRPAMGRGHDQAYLTTKPLLF